MRYSHNRSWTMKGVASAMHPRRCHFQTMSQAGKTAIAAVGVILGLSGCASHPWGPESEIDKETLAFQGYGFYDGPREFDAFLNFVSRYPPKRAAPPAPPPPTPTCHCHH